MFDHSARRVELKARLNRAGLKGALITFSRDVYYYTGLAQPACLVVFSDRDPAEDRLFIRAGLELARENGSLDPAGLEPMRHPVEAIRAVLPSLAKGPVGLTLDTLTALQADELAKALDGRPVQDVAPLILDQRRVKDQAELELMAAAARAVDAGHRIAREVIRPGLSELELAAEVEKAIRLAGHCGTVFMRQPDFAMGQGPLASGENLLRHSGLVYTISGVGLSPALPAGPSRRRLKTGDLIVIDIPACVNGYHSDLSRTYCLGPAADEVKELYGELKSIVDEVAEKMRPDMTAAQCFDLAHGRAARAGLESGFCAFSDGRKAHFIGHGLGLEVNEPPLLARNSQMVLKKNMTLTLEMHLLQGGKVVKLEDTAVLTDRGCRVLNRTPRGLLEV